MELSFQIALNWGGFFWFFGGWCIVAFIFTLVFVKETKGKSLEEITNLFRK